MARIVSGPEITGLVTNKQTGTPIGGATVTVSAAVYTDPDFTSGTTTLTADGMGVFFCYASRGTYTFTTTAAGAGPIESVTVRGGGGPSSTSTEAVNTVAASGAAQTLPDVTVATIHDVTLTANCTFTFPTLAAGKSFTVRLTQDGTGSRIATWPATVKWPGAVAPTLSTGAGKQDILSFLSVAGTAWSGFVAGLDLR